MKMILWLALATSLYFNYHQYQQFVGLQKSVAFIQNNIDKVENSVSSNEKASRSITKPVEVKVESDVVENKLSAIKKDDDLADIRAELQEEFEDYYDGDQTINIEDINKEFEESGRQFLETNLRLPTEKFDEYLQIKKGFQKERDEYFKKNASKFAENEIYIPSQEEIIEQTEILSKHLDKIKASFGEENFKSYMKFVQRFNQELVRRTPPGAPNFIIDF